MGRRANTFSSWGVYGRLVRNAWCKEHGSEVEYMSSFMFLKTAVSFLHRSLPC